jgi:ribosomal protein L40E
MKVCINCYTENPLDAALCSECGMSLTRAPSPEEARKLEEEREERSRQPEQPPTASGIVYLFGEQFARPLRLSDHVRREVFALLANCYPDDRARLEYSGERVHLRDLANRLFEAAFVSLAQKGYISLRLDKRKGRRGATEALTVTQAKSAHDMPPSLERAILDVLRGDGNETSVTEAVAGLIRAERPRSLLRPWGKISASRWVVVYVMERLAAQRYLGRDVERLGLSDHVCWSPNEDAIAPMAGEVETLKSMLETFATVNPDLHETLLREVRAGISRADNPVAR